MRNNTYLIEITRKLSAEVFPVFNGGTGSLNRLVLGDPMLWLGRRRSARLSWVGGYPGGEYVFFEEVLMDKFFQLPPEAFAVGDLVSLTVM